MKKIKQIISIALCTIFIISIVPISANADNKPVMESEYENEVFEYRSSNSKHYRTENDHEFKAVYYNNDVHYLCGNEWLDIDNSLESEFKSGKKYYKNKSNNFKVSFSSDNSKNDLVELKYQNYKLSFAIADSVETSSEITEMNGEANTKIGIIKYNALINDADVIYTVFGSSLKEDIIFYHAPERNYIEYIISTKKLELSKNEDDSISVNNDSGEIVYTIESPIIYDADGNTTNIETSLQKCDKKKYILRYTVDSSFFEDDNVEYPITLDPQIALGYKEVNIYDTYVDNSSPNSNFNSNQNLYVGDNGSKICNTYIKFTNSLTLPSDAQLIHADLNLTYKYKTTSYDPASKACDINIKPLNLPNNYTWSSITYNNHPSVNNNVVCTWDSDDIIIYNSFYKMKCDVTDIVNLWNTSNYQYVKAIELSPVSSTNGNMNIFLACNIQSNLTQINLSNYETTDAFNFIYAREQLYPSITVYYNSPSTAWEDLPLLPRGYMYYGAVGISSMNRIRFKTEQNVTQYAFYLNCDLDYNCLGMSSNSFVYTVIDANHNYVTGGNIDFQNIINNHKVNNHYYAFTLNLSQDSYYYIYLNGWQGTATFLTGTFSLFYEYNYQAMNVGVMYTSQPSLIDLTDDYGYRYIGNKYSFHSGIDIGIGVDVMAVASGTVVKVGNNTSDSGYCIAIKCNEKIPGTNKDLVYCYFHLTQKAQFSVGDTVTKGTKLGHSGGTNGTSNPYATHIHLSTYVMQSGEPFDTYTTKSVDPKYFLHNVEFNHSTIH